MKIDSRNKIYLKNVWKLLQLQKILSKEKNSIPAFIFWKLALENKNINLSIEDVVSFVKRYIKLIEWERVLKDYIIIVKKYTPLVVKVRIIYERKVADEWVPLILDKEDFRDKFKGGFTFEALLVNRMERLFVKYEKIYWKRRFLVEMVDYMNVNNIVYENANIGDVIKEEELYWSKGIRYRAYLLSKDYKENDKEVAFTYEGFTRGKSYDKDTLFSIYIIMGKLSVEEVSKFDEKDFYLYKNLVCNEYITEENRENHIFREMAKKVSTEIDEICTLFFLEYISGLRMEEVFKYGSLRKFYENYKKKLSPHIDAAADVYRLDIGENNVVSHVWECASSAGINTEECGIHTSVGEHFFLETKLGRDVSLLDTFVNYYIIDTPDDEFYWTEETEIFLEGFGRFEEMLKKEININKKNV